MDTSAQEYLKGAIEALLFISEKPVLLEHIAEVMQESVGTVDVRKLLDELKEEYENKQRGMMIVEIAGGYQMLTSPHYVSYVRNFLKTKVKEKLSRPALETLAIVAYKQPVSRGDVELVRGVNSDGVVLHLLNKGLIKIVGKKDVPGRPYLYGSSKLFLEYFGLKSLRDLPKIEDVSLLLANAEQENIILETEDLATQGESLTAASYALDQAEKEASQATSLDQEVLSSESENLELPADLSEQKVADRGLSQEAVDISRGDLEIKEPPVSLRIDQIVAQESSKIEKESQ